MTADPHNSVIRITYKAHAYEIPEPVGERALVLFNQAMGACIKAGVLDVLSAADGKAEADLVKALGVAGIKVAALPEGHLVARMTLAGGKVDGTEITAANYPEVYARPGRYVEPHIVALMVWMRAGFFGAPSTSGAAKSSEGAATGAPPGND